MKIIFWRAFLFLAAFQLEVRVRAGETILDPVGQPDSCWTRAQGICSVQAGARALTLKTDKLELWGGGESLFSRTEKDWQFLKGSVRARSTESAELSFPFGKVSSETGEFWILESGDRFVVRAIQGSVVVLTKGQKELAVPEGLEIWVGPINSSGQYSYGVPSVISVEDHLRRWAQLKDVSKEEFITQARELRTRWKDRQEVAASLYDQVSQRNLASVAAQKKAEDQKAQSKESEKEKFRQMLRERAFER